MWNVLIWSGLAEDIGTGLDQRQLLEHATNTFRVIPCPYTRPLRVQKQLPRPHISLARTGP